MATSNFGIGYVNPVAGSEGSGFWWDSPKQTIEQAITAGFKHLCVLPGAHTISSITSEIYIDWYPGGHLLVNAPVVCSVPVGLATPGPGVSEEAGPIITAPSIVSDYFQFTNGASIMQGGYIGGIGFDSAKISRSAVYATNLTHTVAEFNYLTGANWANVPIFYVQPTGAGEASYWQLYKNNPRGRPLLRLDNTAGADVFGWRFRSNPCYGIAATDPLIHVTGPTRGMVLMNNHFDGTTGACPAAVYFDSATNQVYWYGNSGENLGGTDNLIARFDDVASAYEEQSLGDLATDGNMRINGTLYSDTSPDTGTDGRGGREINPNGWLSTVIMGRY
jgi:hypothetical protein